MNRGILVVALCLLLRGASWASPEDLSKAASSEADQLQTGETGQKEAPPTDIDSSTDVVTPVTRFAEKDLHQQALDELIKANNLSIEDQYEAASDLSLQAYDDLMALHLKRKGRDRARLQTERRQAATTYVQSAIAYIQQFETRVSGAADAQDEIRSRFEDLRDVAREYPELNKKLDAAIGQLPPVKPK